MVPTPPLRWIFRSRYAAMLWAFGVCLMAYDMAGGGSVSVDAANSADSNAAQASALAAEDVG
jgi:hypothetical protein